MWAPQLARLAGSFRVAAPDRRGFGRSSAPPGLAAEVGDLVRLLDQLGMARARIVGMSQAGRVALEAALRHPDRIEALVLHGAPLGEPAPESPEAIPVAAYVALVREGRLDAMKAAWRVHPLMRTMTTAAAAAAAAILADYDGRDLIAPGQALAALGAADLARVAAPVLVLTGAEDTQARRAAGDDYARLLPRAQRVEIPDAGHLCNLCRPDAYNAALRDFFAAP
jgi:pimeloyl-ACP methyl ester carboxylesterase